MTKAVLILLPALAVVAGCAAQQGDLQIRPTKSALTAIARPIPQRIAEANGQLALGNVALALDGYRRASREDPSSTDALSGIAISYDRMGRYDLSRRYYESALAVAPGDLRLLGLLADSLAVQGRVADAERVREEIATRASATAVTPATNSAKVTAPIESVVSTSGETFAVPAVSRAATAPAQLGPTTALPSVTVTLPAARPATPFLNPAVLPADPETTAPETRLLPAAGLAPRLERLSSGEVALVTRGGPLWRAEKIAVTPHTTTIRFVPLRQAAVTSAIRLLNAARVDRLASRTRVWLTARGWRQVTIGDAAAARSESVILYPAAQRAIAKRLSSHLGFAIAERATGAHVTVILGKDAARAPRS